MFRDFCLHNPLVDAQAQLKAQRDKFFAAENVVNLVTQVGPSGRHRYCSLMAGRTMSLYFTPWALFAHCVETKRSFFAPSQA